MTQAIVASSLPKGTEDFHEIMKSKWFLIISATKKIFFKEASWVDWLCGQCGIFHMGWCYFRGLFAYLDHF